MEKLLKDGFGLQGSSKDYEKMQKSLNDIF
jgi:hypothetical protein